MNTASTIEDEFIEAQIAVVATRLTVVGLLWCIAVGLTDRVTADATDPYVANTRLALWMFLAEMLFAIYRVHYTIPASYPLYKKASFIAAECYSRAHETAVYTAVNLILRWIMVTLLTAFAISFLGTSYLTRLAALVPSVAFVVSSLYGLSSVGTKQVIRGTHVGSYQDALAKAAALILYTRTVIVQRKLDEGFDASELKEVQVYCCPFGGLLLPFNSLDPHYLFLGTTGSGKTLCIRMLLNAAVKYENSLCHRALIYDGKREFVPMLVGMGIPMAQIHIMNPADLRASAWAVASDVHSRDDAVNITHILIPDDKNANENPFFILAVRAIVAEVMNALHTLSPGTWRLIDLVNALRTPDLIKRVLKTTKEGEQTSARYFSDAEEMVGGIIATIDARFISQYDTIARVWARCTRSVSLTGWIKDKSILLLGYDANRQAVDRINQALFQRAAQLIGALPEDAEKDHAQSWFVLDEVRFTGKLPMLPELMSFGRSKHAHVVLGPQDVDGLNDIYGEHVTNEIIGLCGNVGALRISSPMTRDGAAKFFGDYESFDTEFNGSSTTGGSSTGGTWSKSSGWSQRKIKRESVLASDLFNLPPTNRVNGIHGYFATPAMGAWRAEIPPSFIEQYLPRSDPEAKPFIPRPGFSDRPYRWSASDEEHFTRPHQDDRPPPKPPEREDTPDKPKLPKPPEDGSDKGSSGDSLPEW